MTGPEHYKQAEDCIEFGSRASDEGDHNNARDWLRIAQVHATLALAAATALGGEGGLPVPDWDAWRVAAATKAKP